MGKKVPTVTERDSGSIEWFGHAGSLHRESRSLRFYGEVGEEGEERTLNVAVLWETLEALEGQQSEVRDHLRYGPIFEANRSRLEQIAERKYASGAPLHDGYLLIEPEDL